MLGRLSLRATCRQPPEAPLAIPIDCALAGRSGSLTNAREFWTARMGSESARHKIQYSGRPAAHRSSRPRPSLARCLEAPLAPGADIGTLPESGPRERLVTHALAAIAETVLFACAPSLESHLSKLGNPKRPQLLGSIP